MFQLKLLLATLSIQLYVMEIVKWLSHRGNLADNIDRFMKFS